MRQHCTNVTTTSIREVIQDSYRWTLRDINLRILLPNVQGMVVPGRACDPEAATQLRCVPYPTTGQPHSRDMMNAAVRFFHLHVNYLACNVHWADLAGYFS